MKARVSIRTILIVTLCSAFVLPCLLLSLLVFSKFSSARAHQREMLLDSASLLFGQIIESELTSYEKMTKTFCAERNNQTDATLMNSPLLVCGTVDEKGVPRIVYRRSAADYLNAKSLQQSPWWGELVRASDVFWLLGVETGVVPPYFRKFNLWSQQLPRGGRKVFALFDPLRLHNLLAEANSRFSDLLKATPLLVSKSENSVLYAPDNFRYRTLFDPVKMNFGQKTMKLGDRELAVTKRNFPNLENHLDLVFLTDPNAIDVESAQMSLLLVFCNLFIVTLAFIGSMGIQQLIGVPLMKLSSIFDRSSKDLRDLKGITQSLARLENSERVSVQEMDNLHEGAKSLMDAIQSRDEKLKALNHELVDAASMARLGELAAQVAHDIRSPLSALTVGLEHSSGFSEESRVMMRRAVERIRDIASDLMAKNRLYTNKHDQKDVSTVQFLAPLIEQMVAEKKLQFKGRPGVGIDLDLGRESYLLFVQIAATEFKRVLSNLIDNAVEAIGSHGRVELRLSASEKMVHVCIRDNGKGIPRELLPRLGQKGETFGKTGGSGLGLYSAKLAVQSWKGTLNISSEPGEGTVVTVSLPRREPPSWFLDELIITRGTTVVIVDDDVSIHQKWQCILEANGIRGSVEVIHLSSPEQAKKWYTENGKRLMDTLFLVDYEFLGHSMNGLELIQVLGIGEKSVLVTSRYEEKSIVDKCDQLNLKLIPKGMTSFVTISLHGNA